MATATRHVALPDGYRELIMDVAAKVRQLSPRQMSPAAHLKARTALAATLELIADPAHPITK